METTSCKSGYQSVESSTTNSSGIDSRCALMSGTFTPPRSTTSLRTMISYSQQNTPSPSTSDILSCDPPVHSNRTSKSVLSTNGPLSNSCDVVSFEDLTKYKHISSEIERVARNVQTTLSEGDNDELQKQLGRDVRRLRRNSNRILQNQKELLEKMSRQERSGFRRFLSVNREQKMEKLRNKLAAKLLEAVEVDEELQYLERHTTSCCDLSSSHKNLDIDALSLLEGERQNLLSTIVISSRRTDIQDLHARMISFTSEKKASQSVLKQVDQVELYYRKALCQLQLALSAIVAPSYTGLLKEFVLGPYPLAIEAAHLVEGAGRMIQPQSCRKYSEFAPKISGVRTPEFPPPMVEFGKRGARSNFDPNNAAAVEAIRKLRASENVVLQMQRLVIEKLELIEKWRKAVESDFAQAEAGYQKCDSKLNEYMKKQFATTAAA